ncbi:MAG: hypothetical protein FGM57_02845 [Candidatus Taylorbacteria bacterium]|nr:hypothetical protein [Candidatus Taylorbacteria bacterium]
MIHIREGYKPESTPDPETLFRELHRNNADILDRICKADANQTYEKMEVVIRQLRNTLITTYGVNMGEFEGEFDREIPGIGTLHVKFYSMGFMDLTLKPASH